MSNLKAIIRKAIKHGFDLSGIPEYSPTKFKNGLFEHLVKNHYIKQQKIVILTIVRSYGYENFLFK